MCLNPHYVNVKRESEHGIVLPGPPVLLSCGKCVECLQRQADMWAFRCMCEAKQYEFNCMITLTYNDFFLPAGGSLQRRDLTLFLKRLRERISPVKIRVFYCGEYGSKGMRPHYHVIVFGWKPHDLVFLKSDNGVPLYRSRYLEEIWSREIMDECGVNKRYPMGFVSAGDVTYRSARYCAKYLQKLVHYPDHLVKPFVGMSNRPGIGACAISPEMLVNGIWVDGKNIPIPRYFLKKLEENHDLTEWKQHRQDVAKLIQSVTDPYLKFRHEKFKQVSEKILKKS